MFDEVLVRPAHGARLAAKLDPASATEAIYAVALATPDGEWRGSATIRAEDGSVVFGAWESEEPPRWLVAALHALLRAAWQRRRAGEPWPRRFARWRPAPSASEEA